MVSLPGPTGRFAEYAGNQIGRVSIPFPTWYLAEGTTAWGFPTGITIENPNASAVKVKVTCMPTGAPTRNETLTLPKNPQTTLTNDHLMSVMGERPTFPPKCSARTRLNR